MAVFTCDRKAAVSQIVKTSETNVSTIAIIPTTLTLASLWKRYLIPGTKPKGGTKRLKA